MLSLLTEEALHVFSKFHTFPEIYLECMWKKDSGDDNIVYFYFEILMEWDSR